MTTSPEPKPEPLVPPDLKAIVDAAAGRAHSAEGSVMRCLADVLAAHAEMLAQPPDGTLTIAETQRRAWANKLAATGVPVKVEPAA